MHAGVLDGLAGPDVDGGNFEAGLRTGRRDGGECNESNEEKREQNAPVGGATNRINQRHTDRRHQGGAPAPDALHRYGPGGTGGASGRRTGGNDDG
jgi:hypothetical protein